MVMEKILEEHVDGAYVGIFKKKKLDSFDIVHVRNGKISTVLVAFT